MLFVASAKQQFGAVLPPHLLDYFERINARIPKELVISCELPRTELRNI